MVGLWSPEPPKDTCDENLRAAVVNVVVVEDSSSESDDDARYEGYEPLQQGALDFGDTDADADDNEGCTSAEEGEDFTLSHSEPLSTSEPESSRAAEGSPDISQVQNVANQQLSNEETRTVWASPRGHGDISMDSEQVAQVRAAMAGFSLPTSAFPPWATSVPEDQWKQQLTERLQTLQGISSD